MFQKIFAIHILFLSGFSYTQNQPMDTKLTKIKYGSIIVIKRGEKIILEDDLSIALGFFSHKNSVDGTLTKASAYLLLSIHNEETEQILSVYSNDYTKPEEELNSFKYSKTVKGEDGFEYKVTTRNHDRFIFWKSYEIQLKAFEYDEFIKILVSKKHP
ncbi:hypothetical protein [Aquimarina sp. Aq107]|uniref:hypothetical protein n=1 Tax=Aquimarina sp. Aq107 TaxID=1191912 RepID=UPI00131EE4B4|nr:hypothetical protein [Aquimarina sp. Aq107]